MRLMLRFGDTQNLYFCLMEKSSLDILLNISIYA